MHLFQWAAVEKQSHLFVAMPADIACLSVCLSGPIVLNYASAGKNLKKKITLLKDLFFFF